MATAEAAKTTTTTPFPLTQEEQKWKGWEQAGLLPPLIANDTKRRLVVAACVSADEFIAFRNEIFLELTGEIEVFHEILFLLAQRVLRRRAYLVSDLAQCLRATDAQRLLRLVDENKENVPPSSS